MTTAATEPAPKLGEIMVDAGDVSQDEVDLALLEQDLGDDRLVGEIIVAHGAAEPVVVAEALERQGQHAEGGDSEPKGSRSPTRPSASRSAGSTGS